MPATTDNPPRLERPSVDTAELGRQMVQVGRHLHQQQWMPANTGNLSTRIDGDRFLITANGCNKGMLTARDLVPINARGQALREGAAPSVELPLHLALYAYYPKVGAIIHTHSVAATMLSRMASETLVLEGYEMLAALDGVDSKNGRVALPIFSNYEDYKHLAIWFHRYVVRFPENSGLLIMGHGLYSWGATTADALRQVEALEFMLQCELQGLQIAPPPEE